MVIDIYTDMDIEIDVHTHIYIGIIFTVYGINIRRDLDAYTYIHTYIHTYTHT